MAFCTVISLKKAFVQYHLPVSLKAYLEICNHFLGQTWSSWWTTAGSTSILTSRTWLRKGKISTYCKSYQLIMVQRNAVRVLATILSQPQSNWTCLFSHEVSPSKEWWLCTNGNDRDDRQRGSYHANQSSLCHQSWRCIWVVLALWLYLITCIYVTVTFLYVFKCCCTFSMANSIVFMLVESGTCNWTCYNLITM